MLWFDGSIKNAVDKVKSSGAFLLVFVQDALEEQTLSLILLPTSKVFVLGKDYLSKQYEYYLNEEKKLRLDDFVAIKISDHSTALQQFKQIYISVPIPSIFIIKNNGIPLRIVSSDRISEVNRAIADALNNQKINKEKRNAVEFNEKVFTHSVNQDNKEPILRPSRQIKNIGRKLFDVSEEELKKRLKEIRAFPKFLLIDSPGPLSCSHSSPKQQQSARIQFRLPNSTKLSWEFPDLSTLGDVRAYLMEKMKLSPNFRLLRTCPRSAFTSEDDKKTLAELSLTPSATLILVPVEDKKIQAKMTELLVHRSFLMNILSVAMKPLFAFFNFFKKHVFKIHAAEMKTLRRLPSDTDTEEIVNKKTSTSNIRDFEFEEDTDTNSEHSENGNST